MPKKESCTIMITALFLIVPKLKQPNCPPIGEWIKKLWYILTLNNMNEFQKHSVERKKVRHKKYPWYESISMKL